MILKKPFIALKGFGDIFGLLLCILLCVGAISLFNGEDKSLPAFSDGSKTEPKGLYALVETKTHNN